MQSTVTIGRVLSLSHDLILSLMEFLEYQDQLEFISSHRSWYQTLMRKAIRKLSFDEYYEGLIGEISSAIEDPYKQLTVSCMDHYFPDELFRAVQYSFAKLVLDRERLLQLLEITDRLRVKQLSILESSTPTWQELMVTLSKVVDCHNLSFYCNSHEKINIIPFFPSVRSLSISGAVLAPNTFQHYYQHLQYLSLSRCTISDVSMLGSIPCLELSNCQALVDISGLNNNSSIIVELCPLIQDFSHCFRNSRKIHIVVDDNLPSYHFDFSYWTKVEELTLIELRDSGFKWSFQGPNNQLPTTVKRCHLECGFVTMVDFTVTPNHRLQELSLWNNDSIQRLTGYGLDRVKRIECNGLDSLISLEGLGSGKNLKVVIKGPSEIQDFSVINDLPSVEIHYCRHFSNPLQLKGVRDLTILPCRELTFAPEPLLSSNPYKHVYSLSLTSMELPEELIDFVKSFDGLEGIPHLLLDFHGYDLLKRFLSEHKELRNQRIVLNSPPLTLNPCEVTDLIALHDEYLKDQYDYSNRFPARWIWFRKNF